MKVPAAKQISTAGHRSRGGLSVRKLGGRSSVPELAMVMETLAHA